MKYGVLGTGMVGKAIAGKLVAIGHEVMMGSRIAGNEQAREWVSAAGSSASQGTFAETAAFGELLFNCTSGSGSLEALGSANPEDLEGKVLVDVANPLDFSQGMPPSLSVVNTDSLGEQIQRAFPDARVVKALNTVNCRLMVDPARVSGEHALFIAGDDRAAKQAARELLQSFGWAADRITDLGDITAARATEMYLPLWLRLIGTLQSADFNIKVVH